MIPALSVGGPRAWAELAAVGLRQGFADLDYVGALPLIVWIAAALPLGRWWRTRVWTLLRHDSVERLLIMTVLCTVVPVALVAGAEDSPQFAVLRYMPHAVVASVLASLLLVWEMIPWELARRVTVAVLVLTTSLCVSQWVDLPSRTPQPWSWWIPTLVEIADPDLDPWVEVASVLRHEGSQAPTPATPSSPPTPPSDSRDQSEIDSPLVRVLPPFAADLLAFNDRDAHRIQPDVSDNSLCEKILRGALGAELAESWLAEPEWVVVFGTLREPPRSYELIARVPAFRPRPDSSRPELTRHQMPSPTPVLPILVYRRVRGGGELL